MSMSPGMTARAWLGGRASRASPRKGRARWGALPAMPSLQTKDPGSPLSHHIRKLDGEVERQDHENDPGYQTLARFVAQPTQIEASTQPVNSHRPQAGVT